MKIKPIFFILLWYPIAMQFMRYLHALSVGGRAFADHFGLSDFSRVSIFMLCAPTVQFIKKGSKTHPDKHKSSHLVINGIYIALVDILLLVAVCGLVLFLQLDILLPEFLQRVVRVYIMGISTSILRVVFECPVLYWLRDDSRVARILPIYDRPYLTASPRDLWHRWSVTAGYHLRKGLYEPFGGSKNRIVATAAAFFVNCILHIYWWSMAIKGQIDYIYWNLLFMYPLASFLLQDLFNRIFGSTTSTTEKRGKSMCHNGANLMLLWVGFYAIGEAMSDAHGLNSSLTAVCRANLLLPPLD
jgi:hypothetical protein